LIGTIGMITLRRFLLAGLCGFLRRVRAEFKGRWRL
jgi:hypothetical protein